MLPVCPAGNMPAPSPPEPLAWSSGQGDTRAALRAVMVTLLAWAALLCAGLGGTVGVVSQTLAGKLAASAQHLQRQGGTSLASRAVRRELPAVAAGLQVAEASRAVVEVHADGALPSGDIALPMGQQRSDARAPAATEPGLSPRHRAPPSRAPPILA